MNYLFDTNAIIIYLKDNKIKEWIDENLNSFVDLNTAIISVVMKYYCRNLDKKTIYVIKNEQSWIDY